jgi:hypothetical protein
VPLSPKRVLTAAGRADSCSCNGIGRASDDARDFTGNPLFVDGSSHINGAAWAPELPEEP